MTEFLDAILAFPTVLFTILLGVVTAYWLFVMLGALDVDLLGDVDGGEVIDADGDGSPDGFAGVIHSLGLAGVPLTLVLSLLVLAAWVLCLISMQILDSRSAAIGAGVALVSFALAIPLTALAVRPMRRFFVSHPALENRSLVGKVCRVTTLSVNERYGQAEIEDGGAGLLIQVRYNGPGRLARGDQALIFDYKEEVFQVAPVGEALQRSLEDLA